jgi:anaerobic selenocysteine-containing dehydrogenase
MAHQRRQPPDRDGPSLHVLDSFRGQLRPGLPTPLSRYTRRMSTPSAQIRHSVCALDCPDACSLLINVDENGKGSRLRGNPDHPVTRGFLCAKVAQYLDREYSPDRLLYPQKRIGAKGQGRFTRITWDEAIDTIAEHLTQTANEFGPESILPYSYAGTMGMLNGSGMDRRFFHRLGASRLDRTICSSAGGVALTQSFGIRVGTEPEQFRDSKLILAWGSNVLTTNVHLWPFINEARRNGAKFYVIDPVRKKTGELADRFYRINPGTDLALALGMIHVILRENLQDQAYIDQFTNGFAELKALAAGYTPERVEGLTGILREEIVQLAREYATTRPAVIRANYGIQRSERGGSAMRAIAALPAITGSWREVGGGFQLSTSGGFQFNRAYLEKPELQQIALGREARMLNMTELGKVLTAVDDPPVKATIVYNSNPMAIAPNQNLVRKGFAREDLFTVVLEQFQTDTADFADVLLPATTFLEHTDVYFAYGHYYLQMARPALASPGETKTNVEVFRLLAKRMGFTDPCFDESEESMIAGLLDSKHRYLDGISFERLERERSVRLNVSENSTPFQPFAQGGFETTSRKFEFGAEALDFVPPVESRLGSDSALRDRFPLELISSKSHDSMNSTFGNRKLVQDQTGHVAMNSRDAETRGIVTGDLVRIFNDRGSLTLRAEVDGVVGPGVVHAPAVRWAKHSPDQRSINALTSDRLTDIGGGATFYSCLVQIEKCGD